MIGNVSNIPQATSFIKRPFGIGTFIGIQGSILTMVGIFFPWSYSLASRIYWTMGTQLSLGWLAFFISLLAIICFVFRTSAAYRLGLIFGILALIISGPYFFLFITDSRYIVGGLDMSFTGSILMTLGGIIGYLRTPKQTSDTQ
jgi:uncharacterized membrane protein (UPF0136 family)